MTYRIVFTKRADDDLLEIWSYIAADSPASADRVLAKIFDQIDKLAKHPHAGRVVRISRNIIALSSRVII